MWEQQLVPPSPLKTNNWFDLAGEGVGFPFLGSQQPNNCLIWLVTRGGGGGVGEVGQGGGQEGDGGKDGLG